MWRLIYSLTGENDMALRPIKSLRDAEVSPGDVIRWGSGARWAIVCETDCGPQGFEGRLRWAFGADAGEWVPSESGVIVGWVLLSSNKHASYRRSWKHAAKDRRNARTDIYAVLGEVEARKILGEQPAGSALRNPLSRNPTEH